MHTDLSGGARLAQTTHAVACLTTSLHSPSAHSCTGRSSCCWCAVRRHIDVASTPAVVVLANDNQLRQLQQDADRTCVPFAAFREPDLGWTTTAVGLLTPNRQLTEQLPLATPPPADEQQSARRHEQVWRHLYSSRTERQRHHDRIVAGHILRLHNDTDVGGRGPLCAAAAAHHLTPVDVDRAVRRCGCSRCLQTAEHHMQMVGASPLARQVHELCSQTKTSDLSEFQTSVAVHRCRPGGNPPPPDATPAPVWGGVPLSETH